MARIWNEADFARLYDQFICTDVIQTSGRAYYRRYRPRYRDCLLRLAKLAPPGPIDVLDIGVGQLALMCRKMWNDRAAVSDLPGKHLSYMEANDVQVFLWNLCKTDAPFDRKFDVIFFSEVIEHLPIPGHIVLERLRLALKPGGLIICTTPNLYRLRNVFCMAFGVRIFDYFRIPEGDTGISHILEYSRDHLLWQFKRAGFVQCHVEFGQTHLSPTNPLLRPLAWLGYPLLVVPRFRDNLIAIAYAPGASIALTTPAQ